LAAHTFGIAVGYLLFAAVFAAFGWYVAKNPGSLAPEQAGNEADVSH
jgi:hypothetical protein